jgi:hypothetical protein
VTDKLLVAPLCANHLAISFIVIIVFIACGSHSLLSIYIYPHVIVNLLCIVRRRV